MASRWGHAESRKRAKFYELTAAGRRALRLEATRWYRYVVGVTRVMAIRTEPVVVPIDRPAIAYRLSRLSILTRSVQWSISDASIPMVDEPMIDEPMIDEPMAR